MGGVGEQLEHLEKAQGLVEQGPVALVAALLLLALLVSVPLFVTLWLRAVLRFEKLQRIHAKEMAVLQQDHSERVDSIRLSELERAVRLEHIVQGMLRLVTFGGRVRAKEPELEPEPKPKRRRRGSTDPRLSLPMEPEAPTLVLETESEEEPNDD